VGVVLAYAHADAAQEPCDVVGDAPFVARQAFDPGDVEEDVDQALVDGHTLPRLRR
jgi:hypothetical protein